MKRQAVRAGMIFFCVVLFWLSSPRIFAEEEVALLLNQSAQVTLNGAIFPRALLDNNLSSKYQPKAGDVLEISSEEPVGYVYLLFNRPPPEYPVTFDGKPILCGRQGFLHELIRFEEGAKKVSINLPETEICDVYVYTKGMLPDSVQQWQPPYEDCDMLLLPTHADDEHLFFGGIMPYYAGQEGKKLQVAYLTNHWGEWYRPHELLAGLWEVGITAYPIISDFHDYYSQSLEHAETLYDTQKMLGYQVELIRRFQPEVVIDHDTKGEYGHGVHMLNTSLVTQAIAQSGDPAYFPDSAARYGVFEVQKTYLHLYPENTLVMEVDTPLSHFGGKTAYEKAVEGFSHHASQQKWFKVEKSGRYDCRKFGLYHSTVGLDSGKNDFFEHVTFSDAQPEEVSSAPESVLVSSVPTEEPPAISPESLTNTSGGSSSEAIILIIAILLTAVIIAGVMLAIKKKHRR